MSRDCIEVGRKPEESLIPDARLGRTPRVLEE